MSELQIGQVQLRSFEDVNRYILNLTVELERALARKVNNYGDTIGGLS